MQLPFTADEFFEVFRQYNESVWPAQIVLIALAIAAVSLVAFPRRWSGIGISAILSLLWIWPGLFYHLAFFASINPVAYAFSAVSVAGACAFIWHGIAKRRLEFRFSRSMRSLAGIALIAFSLVAYPVWATYAGHRYPGMPTFGLPCPTTIFTLGMLALLVKPYPRMLLLVPVLWCFIGAQAAFLLGVPQDLSLILAGIVGIALAVRSRPSALGSEVLR